MNKNLFAIPVLFALSACGGSSPKLGFVELEDRGDALAERFENMEITPLSDMPTTGSATYSGVAGYAPGDINTMTDEEVAALESELVSEMSLTASFVSGEVSGAFTNFSGRDKALGEVSGRIDILNGEVVDNMLVADLDGRITDDYGPISVDGELGGVFAGADHRMVGGALDLYFFDLGANEGWSMVGAFVGERD
jgi:hypothetical protein